MENHIRKRPNNCKIATLADTIINNKSNSHANLEATKRAKTGVGYHGNAPEKKNIKIQDNTGDKSRFQADIVGYNDDSLKRTFDDTTGYKNGDYIKETDDGGNESKGNQTDCSLDLLDAVILPKSVKERFFRLRSYRVHIFL